MKLLDGKELADFIKERQAKQVRSLIQSADKEPRLAIIQTKDDPVIDTYVRLKKAYGKDIGVQVDVYKIRQRETLEQINVLNEDASVHGIIVQLPLDDETKTDEILNAVLVNKDVDGLAENSSFIPATPMAIAWLLDGYNVPQTGAKIAVVGQGRLVGRPLTDLLEAQSYDVYRYEKRNEADLISELASKDIIISATGTPGLIVPEMLKQGAVVVDAGVAVEGAQTRGDLADSVYVRDDLTLTPRKGGVGPLTVCALFENLLRAASAKTS